MPRYDLYCSCGMTPNQYMTFEQYDVGAFPKCADCNEILHPGVHIPSLYGLMRCNDVAFADAAEATGERITSTKDIDRLEKAGIIRAVTNPSRHRKFKEKK